MGESWEPAYMEENELEAAYQEFEFNKLSEADKKVVIAARRPGGHRHLEFEIYRLLLGPDPLDRGES